MKRSFFGGLFLGALLASGGFIAHDHFSKRSRSPTAKGAYAEPHYWLLSSDFSIANLYSEPEAMAILAAPESIQFYRAGVGDTSLLDHYFSSTGVAPSAEDAEMLLTTFHAPNAYAGVSACTFDPGVLVRLRRNGHQLDLLICFSCEDLLWVLDQDEKRSGMVGLSDIGIGTLRGIFRRAYPNDPAFKMP